MFQFSREGTNKTLEKEMVVGLLPILLDLHRAPHLDYFLNFLQSISNPRITFDEWNSFLQFQQQCPVDLEGYDEDGAWPVLLDEYVEWLDFVNHFQFLPKYLTSRRSVLSSLMLYHDLQSQEKSTTWAVMIKWRRVVCFYRLSSD